MSQWRTRDIRYSKDVDFDKAFDCAVSATRDMGFTRTQSDRKKGEFVAVKTTGAFSARYTTRVITDKSSIIVTLNEVDAAVPADLNKMIDVLFDAFQKHCGK